jgi:hypothetical protein
MSTASVADTAVNSTPSPTVLTTRPLCRAITSAAELSKSSTMAPSSRPPMPRDRDV